MMKDQVVAVPAEESPKLKNRPTQMKTSVVVRYRAFNIDHSYAAQLVERGDLSQFYPVDALITTTRTDVSVLPLDGRQIVRR